MKLEKIVMIKEKCHLVQTSLEVEKEHPEWCSCQTCPLGQEIEIKTERLNNEQGLESVTLTINPCLMLEEIIGRVKARRKKRKKKAKKGG